MSGLRRAINHLGQQSFEMGGGREWSCGYSDGWWTLAADNGRGPVSDLMHAVSSKGKVEIPHHVQGAGHD